MALIATTNTPAQAYPVFKLILTRVKNHATRFSTELTSNILAEDLFTILRALDGYKSELSSLLATVNSADLIAYAREQEDNVPTYDPQAEYVTLVGHIDAAIVEIVAVPTNALISGWGTNDIIWNTFSTAQTAPLKAHIDNIIAHIS